MAGALAVKAPDVHLSRPAPTVPLQILQPALDQRTLAHAAGRDPLHHMAVLAIGPGGIQHRQLFLTAEKMLSAGREMKKTNTRRHFCCWLRGDSGRWGEIGDLAGQVGKHKVSIVLAHARQGLAVARPALYRLQPVDALPLARADDQRDDPNPLRLAALQQRRHFLTCNEF